ncbi:MAG: hypothetical protein ACJ77K_12510 [Bacteroidia bacterium]
MIANLYKYGLFILLLLLLGCMQQNGVDNPPPIIKEGDSITVNADWLEKVITVADSDNMSLTLVSIHELFKGLSENLPSGKFDIAEFIDSSFGSTSAYLRCYKKNFDSDPELEYVVIAGGLSDNSLLLLLDPEKDKIKISDISNVSSYGGISEIKLQPNGSYDLFEVISFGGGSTDFRADAHMLYKWVNGKAHKVLEVHEGKDISGTLKVATSVTMQMWDTTGKEDAVLVHYNTEYWLCNAYDIHDSDPSKANWDLFKAGSCDPPDGIILIKEKYPLLLRWSNDSLKYVPDHSRGLTAEQWNLLENINSSGQYAGEVFNAFKNDIYARIDKSKNTVVWLEDYFGGRTGNLKEKYGIK